METKSFELYVQSAIWCGGIAAAACGGVLAATISHDTPPELIPWLQGMAVVLLVALGAAAYMQLHAISTLNRKENNQPEEAAKSARYIGVSQFVMIVGLWAAGGLLATGLVRETREPPKEEWAVAGAFNLGKQAIVVMSEKGTGSVRILSQVEGETAWKSQDMRLAAPTQERGARKVP